MPKETEKQRIFTRRAVIFGGVQTAAFTTLLGRLYYLQFIKSKEYRTLSENNRIKLQLIAPERGIIADRYGVAMASNVKNYRLFIDYSALSQSTFRATVERLQSLVPLGEKKLKALRATRVSTASMPELLKEHLSWQELSVVELHLLDLPGVSIDIGQLRHYPFADQAAHLIGYVGTVSEDDISDDEDEPLLRLPDFKIGKSGVEKMLENGLRGTPGIKSLEVNVHGVPVREVSEKPPIAGQNVRLTVDSRLQALAASCVKDQSASVVAMEVATGNVLALVSMPGFDPDIFSTGITTDYWKALSSDEKNPLLNKSISGQYPPGSTFKPMVGLAGFEAGVITPDTIINCPGYFYLGDHRFNCWKAGGHGNIDFHHALQQSCDVFFYTVANRLGIEPYATMARRFGLGAVTGIGLAGEKPGIIPDPAWKMSHYKQRWAGGDTINCAIGQGYVLTTPLQLCTMIARIAGGEAVVPRLFVPASEENPSFEALPVKEEWLDQTRAAMNAVVNEPHGTAYSGRIKQPEFAMAGKTGTSQVRKIVQRGMNPLLVPWKYRHHALFVGFAPVDQPKYACACVIEHGGGLTEAAVPVVRDVLLNIQQWDAKT